MLRSLLAFLLLFSGFASHAQSVLWEISGNGLKKKSYLFGTIHIKDKRVFEFDKVLYKKLKSCKTFAMEITPDASNLAKITKGMMLEDGKTLKDIYSPEEYQLLSDTLKKYTGMPIMLFNTMKPMVLLSMVMESQMPSEKAEALDFHLYNYAKDKKLETLSIETPEEQIAAISNVTPDYVLKTFKEIASSDVPYEKMVKFYCSAELDSLYEYLQEEDSEGFSTEQLLDERNVRMAERIAKMAKDKPVFAAVGAGHLWGEMGVINLLKSEGFKVEPVVLPFQNL